VFNLICGLTYSFIVATLIATEIFIRAIYVIIKDTIEGIVFVINILARMGEKNGK